MYKRQVLEFKNVSLIYQKAGEESLTDISFRVKKMCIRDRVSTLPGRRYAALMAGRVKTAASPREQLKKTLQMFSGSACPAALWETVLFPARVRDYSCLLYTSRCV